MGVTFTVVGGTVEERCTVDTVVGAIVVEGAMVDVSGPIVVAVPDE